MLRPMAFSARTTCTGSSEPASMRTARSVIRVPATIIVRQMHRDDDEQGNGAVLAVGADDQGDADHGEVAERGRGAGDDAGGAAATEDARREYGAERPGDDGAAEIGAP